MSLRYILGPSGTGKTSRCIDEIAAADNMKERLFYIVPEQFTLESERNLLRKKGSFVNINVLGFNHFAYYLISRMGTSGRAMLDTSGRAMLIKKIVLELKDKLEFYGSAADKQGFTDSLSDTLTELMQYNASPEKIEDITDELGECNLKNKLRDISLIYSRYLEYMAKEYIAGDGALDYMLKLIPDSVVEKSEIWIDGFKSFTPQENNVIGELLKYCKRVNIVFSVNSPEISYGNINTLDKDYEVKKAITSITDIARDNNVIIEKPLFCSAEYKNYTPEISFIKHNYFRQSFKPYKDSIENIRLYKYSDMYREIDRVCSDIRTLVMDNGYRYRDIAIIIGSSDYEIPLSLAFKKFEIPNFLDGRRPVSNHPLVTFITSALDIISYGWENSAVFKFLKTGYTSVPYEDIFVLENYVIANGIDRYKWNMEWKYGFKTEESHDNRPQKEVILSTRDSIFEILFPLKNNLSPARKENVRYITERLFELIAGCEIRDKIEHSIKRAEEKGDSLKAIYYEGVWQEFISVTDKMVDILGDEKVSVREYSKILFAGLSAATVGIAPPTQDYVMVGDVERTRFPDIKAMFILGANEGNIPIRLTEKGVFTDEEKAVMGERSLELSPDIVGKTNKGVLGVYANLIKASELLVISYPTSSLQNAPLSPAPLVERIEEMFPEIKEETYDEKSLNLSGDYGFDRLIHYISEGEEEAAEKLYSYYSTKEDYAKRLKAIKRGLYNSIPPKYLSEKLLPKLWEEVIQSVSVSKLESFSGCPFKFYMEYILKARERDTYGIRITDAGIIAHRLLEIFSKHIKKEKIGWEQTDREYINSFVDNYMGDIVRELNTDVYESSRNSAVLNKLSSAIKLTLWASTEQIKAGKFKPEYFEIGFGRSAYGLPAIEIEIDDGKILRLNGIIDRVDKMLDEKGKAYVRIVDYKSSAKSPDINSIYSGLQLQLVMYMNALYKKGDLNPGGMFYFEVNEPALLSGEERADISKEDSLLSRMALRGMYDESISSDLNNAMIKGTGKRNSPEYMMRDISCSDSISLSEEQLKDLMDYALVKAEDTGREMARGKMDISPLEYDRKSPCTYCPYTHVCGFDKSGREGDIVLKDEAVSWEKIQERIKEKKDE